jgi:hypothetical protein
MASTPAFDFVILFVKDTSAAKKYFTETLGFKDVPEESRGTFVYLKGDGGIDFALAQGGEGGRRPVGATEIYFKTHDLEAQRAAYAASGANPTPIMERPFGQIFGLPDFDGVPLVVMGG